MRSVQGSVVRVLFVVAVAAAGAGCSDDHSTAAIPPSTTAVATSTPADAPAASTGDTSAAPDTAAPDTAGPEPTGVPGLDDSDPFCSAWAVYSGTLQAIGVGGAFGGLTNAEVARLELTASPALTDAVGSIGNRWPNDLVSERTSVLADLIGPYNRRAAKAMDALRAAGVTDDEMGQLRVVWLDALRTRSGEDPVIIVAPLGGELEAKVQAAALAFDSSVTPFTDDPSLQVGSVTTPLTDAYLAAHCPDLASSGVGDTI